MAYDHSGDLPHDYDFGFVRRLLVKPPQLSYAHEFTERNRLNKLGHKAVLRGVAAGYGEYDATAAHLGVIVYETLTDTPLVGGDFVGTPTYCDPDGSSLAERLALELTNYDAFDLETISYSARVAMKKDAPWLDSLISEIVGGIVGSDRSFAFRAKVGAALMRNLHIKAQQQMDEEIAEASD